ncbi:salicylate synthase [Saccharothrix australiensis]|uniref:Anthranilate synthase component 1/salicylate synthetase n=1 Tax=Saccharothrix australiensis TaxID=2072 RepID=A0A495VXW6_9PSEU|nr:salicylate synthase [Saccharothrix australiensis]RKT54271.1 anthranilate synthase component 1/salicylate synthetase [Saccharothrix australiensis]
MGRARRYRERHIRTSGDPLLLMASLAEWAPTEPYLIYEREGRWTYAAGVAAEVVVTGSGAVLRGVDAIPAERSSGDPFRALAELLAGVAVEDWRAYGWTAFELAYLADHGAPADLPVAHLFVPRLEVRVSGDRATVRALDPADANAVTELVMAPAEERELFPRLVGPDADSSADYERRVATAIAEIRAGLLQKVVLSRLVPIHFDLDLVGTYVLGRRHNTPRRSFLLNLGGVEAAGFSPETVLEVDVSGRVSTQPLAGTRALVADPVENGRLHTALVTDPKENFEHAISVKEAFKELDRVCARDSVRVEEFMEVLRRGSVQHLASRLAGRLAPGKDAWHAFSALFPAITVSGVPKTAAYACIRRNELQPRGLYGGAVLAVDAHGALDAAVVLRTVFRQAGRTWLRAGAGIVADSLPARELEETREKLRSTALHLVPAVPAGNGARPAHSASHGRIG